MPARRLSRVASAFKAAAGHVILHELNDPRRGFVTVTKVELTPDLKTAQVFVSVMGDEKERLRVITGLRHAHGFIQARIARRLSMRSTPIVEFVEDTTVRTSVRISRLLKELEEE